MPAGGGAGAASAAALFGERELAFCTCDHGERGKGKDKDRDKDRGPRSACAHVVRLVELHGALRAELGGQAPAEAFANSPWYRLLAFLAEDDAAPVRETRVVAPAGAGEVARLVTDAGELLAIAHAPGMASARLLNRVSLLPPPAGTERPEVTPRAHLLAWLMEQTATGMERGMRASGHLTRGQVLEDSIWHRLAYHAFREYAFDAIALSVAVEDDTGAVLLTLSDAAGARLLTVRASTRPATRLLRTLRDVRPRSVPVQRQRVPLALELRPLAAGEAERSADAGDAADASGNAAGEQTRGGLRLVPVVQVSETDGEARTVELGDHLRYDELAHVPELGGFVELDDFGPLAERLRLEHSRSVPAHRSAALLAEVAEVLREHPEAAREMVAGHVYTGFDRVKIDVRALQRDWCWLSLRYGVGNRALSLDALLRARERGERFVDTGDGWLDMEAPAFAPLAHLAASHALRRPGDGDHGDTGDTGEGAGGDDAVRVSRLGLLRLLLAQPGAALGPGVAAAGIANAAAAADADDDERIDVSGIDGAAPTLRHLLGATPSQPLAPLRGLRSTLRSYQVRGVEWLLYLYDNGFGGLLCDDMGLGKTHQVSAFLLALREQRGVEGPFLVVCPTTVLSHWKRIIDDFVPGLRAVILHGGDRDLAAARADADLILTSYGILRNDIDSLSEIDLAAAIFDEAQLLKNPDTLVYGAARRLRAGLLIGLSGTPIENSLSDLAALIDLCAPGYLGTREDFYARFTLPIEERNDAEARATLARLVAPLLLRRTKGAVLDELPSKIEDLRTCTLSEDQVKLYRDAVESRGRELLAALRDPEQPVPYMHVFALLTLLKQICCHPALVAGTPAAYGDYRSDKWELAKELVRESLDSGQKVVVYSQFLGMLEIFERHLRALGIGYAKLTGRTRKRGEVVARFQDDPECRVFLASLTAGGVGIDLVAASVVLHYDRWWNAAREDQATDRVHRMGQTRGVQVIKLVTEGTLEEKIAALIAKKRQLMERVVQTDDGAGLRAFSRDELAALVEF
ncbi:DEAD/DEAH box helicase [Haliangium ochraceum]|uniref:DEAD/DEAH box helicase n=1 Tax=Haliangium ochraceum TaxID=80816 RepID=UPI00019B9B4A|nr:DEAD/DEAH box helicase [Haliangium ochraceum]